MTRTAGGARSGARSENSIVVQKFGGTSVAEASRIRAVAARVVRTVEGGNQVVVVVSAMGDTTDELEQLAAQVTEHPPPRELDMLMSSGERISMALLAMAIDALGYRAASFTGSQAGIITDALHRNARIVDVQARRIVQALEDGTIPIIAGYQGVSDLTKEITTLGRGGSDLTAVALAAALGAGVCEIYTDVDGVYTADPRVVPEARKLHAVSYDEMLEMASTGARVLYARSVELARNHGVSIHVRSSFVDDEGTFVTEEDERMMEKAIISAVNVDGSQAKITLVRVPDRPGIAAMIFRSLANVGANVDMIEQNVSHDGRTDVTFTMPRDDLPQVRSAIDDIARDVSAAECVTDPDIAKLSLVGAGMRTHPGVAADMFEALSEAGVNIEMISTSPIRISCVIRRGLADTAVRAVHDRFRLSQEVVYRAEHPDA